MTSDAPSRRVTPEGVAEVWRREAHVVLAALARRHGDFADCEDAAQEAALAAAAQWPVEGLPDEPRAWLVTVASRRLVDAHRSAVARSRREDHAALAPEPRVRPPTSGRLRRTTRCCCSCCAATRRSARRPGSR